LNYKIESQKNFNKSVKEKYYKKDQNEKQNIWEIAIEGLNWKKNSIQEIRKKKKIERMRTKIKKTYDKLKINKNFYK
jgi:hypothetical protein